MTDSGPEASEIGEGPPTEVSPEVQQATREKALEVKKGDLDAAGATHLEFLDHERKWLENTYLRQLIQLREDYANRLFWLLAAQLIVTNAIFIVYAWEGKDWSVPTTAISVWIGGTFVEVAALVAVIMRNLFPRVDKDPLTKQQEDT